MTKCFYITIKGRKVDTVSAPDEAAAKRRYCAAHPEVAREFVRAAKAPEAFTQ